MGNGWVSSEVVPALDEGMVQVWRIRVDGRGFDEAYALLSGEERARAAGMRSVARREEFVVGRGMLRRLLGAILAVEAEALEFEVGEHGKPRLKEGNYGDSGSARMTALPIEFNVGHSAGCLLIALSRAGVVGVDVERVNPEIEAVEVARTAFSPADAALVEAAEDRVAEFFRCWTRREAVGKADGRGLLRPAEDAGGYVVREIGVAPGFAAAVATGGDVKKWLFLQPFAFEDSSGIFTR